MNINDLRSMYHREDCQQHHQKHFKESHYTTLFVNFFNQTEANILLVIIIKLLIKAIWCVVVIEIQKTNNRLVSRFFFLLQEHIK